MSNKIQQQIATENSCRIDALRTQVDTITSEWTIAATNFNISQANLKHMTGELNESQSLVSKREAQVELWRNRFNEQTERTDAFRSMLEFVLGAKLTQEDIAAIRSRHLAVLAGEQFESNLDIFVKAAEPFVDKDEAGSEGAIGEQMEEDVTSAQIEQPLDLEINPNLPSDVLDKFKECLKPSTDTTEDADVDVVVANEVVLDVDKPTLASQAKAAKKKSSKKKSVKNS